MKLQLTLLALPFLAVANPLAAPEPRPRDAASGSLGPRTCKLTGSDVRYRKCPSTDNKKCPAIGQYGAKGTSVKFTCWTTGSSVNGYQYWDKTSSGYYVSEYYVDLNCALGLPQC